MPFGFASAFRSYGGDGTSIGTIAARFETSLRAELVSVTTAYVCRIGRPAVVGGCGGAAKTSRAPLVTDGRLEASMASRRIRCFRNCDGVSGGIFAKGVTGCGTDVSMLPAGATGRSSDAR